MILRKKKLLAVFLLPADYSKSGYPFPVIKRTTFCMMKLLNLCSISIVYIYDFLKYLLVCHKNGNIT